MVYHYSIGPRKKPQIQTWQFGSDEAKQQLMLTKERCQHQNFDSFPCTIVKDKNASFQPYLVNQAPSTSLASKGVQAR